MPVARRSPPAPARGGASRGGSPIRSSYSGAEGLRKAQEVEEREAANKEARSLTLGQPYRLKLLAGTTRQVVIVDESPNFFRFEHAMQNNRTKHWDVFCACIAENANCPACKALDRPSYYAMYLTVIDLEPYTNSQGVEVPWSKKLMVVKVSQQKKITRLWERNDHNLRGAILQLTRDGEKDASIGNDIELIEFMPEDELEQYVDQYTDRNNKVHDVIGYEPFDYEALFPDMTEQQIRAIVGGQPEPGSRDDTRSSGTARRAPAQGDDWEGGAARAPARAPVRGQAAAPARGAPVRSRPARQVEPEPEPEEVAEGVEGEDGVVYEDEQQDAPPPRRAAPPARAPARSAPAPARAAPAPRPAPGRRPVQDPEPAEDPPQRGAASSLAARRAALRRG